MEVNLEEGFDINKLCRICLCEKDSFWKTTEGIIFKIKKLCDIEFSSEDLICKLCEGEVNRCYNFSTKIINSYNELQKAIEGRKVKEEISDFESNHGLNPVKTEEVTVKEEIEEYLPEDDITPNDLIEYSTNPNVKIETGINLDVQVENSIIPNAQIVNNLDANSTNANTQILGLLILKPSLNMNKVGQVPLVPVASSSNQEISETNSHEETFKCQFCSETFNSQNYLDVHLSSHEGEKFICECGVQFGIEASLKHHIRIDHPEKKPVSCKDCDERFQTKTQLMSHRRLHHAGRLKTVHKCDVCHIIFKKKSQLIDHYMSHTNERSFVCDICGGKYNRKSILSQHKMTHSNERKHLCSYCGKMFKGTNTLLRHTRIHTRERPYKCKVCEMTFTQGSILETHMEVHKETKTKGESNNID